jgi:anti-sigma B factor antagonist
MPMRIKREKKLVRIFPEGEMTIYQAAELKGALLDGMRDGNEIEINLSDVSEMDTAGFQLLVLAKREAARHNKTLRLVAHSAATLGIMDLYNMAAYFGDPVVITN